MHRVHRVDPFVLEFEESVIIFVCPFTENCKHSGSENNSVDATRLARTETRHDFLVHGDLLRASLYERQG